MDRGALDWMRAVLGQSTAVSGIENVRQTVEHVFGNTKHNKGVTVPQKRQVKYARVD